MQFRSALDYIDDIYICPHCKQQLKLCHAPPIHVGDGLGWGSEYLFICLNNECSLFVNGWKQIENGYGHVGSYRYMRLPDSKEEYAMMVAGNEAFTGSVVDPVALRASNKRFQEIKEAEAALDTCVAEHNLQPVLYLLLNEHADLDLRKRAAALIPEINDLACVEPLRSHDYRDSHLEQEINMALTSLLNRNYLKECPYCAELVKNRATICKHCKEGLR